MKKSFTLLLALVASLTGLMADDIQFTNLPYIHYGDSVRVQATTSLPDMPMPTNYEYGFEYEYKNSDGNSGGGGVEPCAIVNGHMEAVLKIKPSDSFQCYRYRPYYSTEVTWSEELNTWNNDRYKGEWVLISEWSQTEWPADPINPMDGINMDSLIAAIDLKTLSPVEITDNYIVVAATANIPTLPDIITMRCGFELETGAGQTHINGWRSFVDGRMIDTLRYNGPYNTFSYRAFLDIDYIPRMEGAWIEVPEWENIMHGTCGENVTWRFNPTDSVLIISGTGAMTNYKSNGTPWYNAFRSNIKSVTISEGVTSIGEYMFNACNNIETINIASSVRTIGKYAFSGCSSLQNINLPTALSSIKEYTFYGCKNLQTIVIPDSVISIGQQVFANCSSLQSVVLPNKVDSIGNFAFNYCSSLVSIVFPDEVAYIGQCLMQICTSLTSVTLPQNLTTIESDFFNGCSSLHEIALPSSLRIIRSGAFRNCTSLNNIDIPQSVTHIEGSAFMGCSGLTRIYIPQNVSQIGTGAFEGCAGITSIEVNAQNTTYDSRENCNAIIETASNKMILCGRNSTIPSSVTILCDKLFNERIDLVTFSIPNNVTTLGANIFRGCKNLNTISIPESVTSIGAGAFSSCSSLTNIQLPSGITSIENSTFSGCSSLTSITIPSNVISIGDYAFQSCYALQNVTLPDGLLSIGKDVFRSIGALKSISIPESVQYIGATAFHDCGIWRNDDNWDGDLLYIDNCLVSAQHGQQTTTGNVRIKEGTRVIGSQVFRTYNISSITLPNSIKYIGGGAFAWCDMLTSITCEAPIPPLMVNSVTGNQFDDVFFYVNKSIPVYVPAGAEELYRNAEYWGEFTNIRTIGQAQTVDVEEIHAEPTDNSVVLEWPAIENAVVYTIEIRKNGELICTLSFNANGQLTNVQFAMSARNRANSPQRAAETTTGWTYTIAGLEANTAYTYTVVATDSSNQEVYNETIPFTTQPQNTPTDFERTEVSDSPNKILSNGQIFILRGEKIYTLTGQEVK
mgnify:CR=1 FL=1